MLVKVASHRNSVSQRYPTVILAETFARDGYPITYVLIVKQIVEANLGRTTECCMKSLLQKATYLQN
jgi:hypothetical protein